MAGDEGEANHGGPPEHGDVPAGQKPGAAPEPLGAREAVAAAGGSGSEWTASDARGPLDARPVLTGMPPRPDDASAPPGYDATGFDREPAAPVEPPEASSQESPHQQEPRHEQEPPRAIVQETQKASLWPVAAGIVIGAVIGAGSAYYVDKTGPGGDRDRQALAVLNSRLDTLTKALDEQQSAGALKTSLAELGAKVAAASATAQAAAASAAQAAQQSQHSENAAATALDGKLALLQTAIATLQTQGQQAAAAADLKAAQTKISAVETTAADLQKQVAALSAQSAAMQGTLGDVRTEQKKLADKITNAPAFAVLADSLTEKINRGQPFLAEVNALEALGIDPAKIAALRPLAGEGVVPVNVLADQFETLSSSLHAAANKHPDHETFWDRMKDGASGLVTVRRTGEPGTSGVSSQIAGIKADLAHGDVEGAASLWALLPDDAKAAPEAAAWGSKAKAHADASAAARAIEHDAIVSLGVKKS